MPITPATWDGYDSELTSLASDDELEDEQAPLPEPIPVPQRPNINTRPSTKQATAKSQKKARTNPHLVPPRITQYSAHQLHSAGFLHTFLCMCLIVVAEMLGEGQINLDPEYQRGEWLFVL